MIYNAIFFYFFFWSVKHSIVTVTSGAICTPSFLRASFVSRKADSTRCGTHGVPTQLADPFVEFGKTSVNCVHCCHIITLTTGLYCCGDIQMT